MAKRRLDHQRMRGAYGENAAWLTSLMTRNEVEIVRLVIYPFAGKMTEKWREGRVFLAGDAAHLFTPLGGLGMNTGIGDVMNLCWKIAANHQGWAGPRLVDTYEGERRSFGVRNSQLGVECTRVMDRWVPPQDCEADGAKLENCAAYIREWMEREKD